MAESAVFLDASVIFPDLDGTPECMRYLVAQLSRTDALLWCARANLIVSNSHNTEEEAQGYAIATFFPEHADRAAVLRWVKKNQAKRGTVFFRAQLMELAFWIARCSQDAPDDGRTFESAGKRTTFGQAALVASTLWSDRVYAGFMEIPRGDSAELRRQAMSNSRASLETNARGTPPLLALGRGASLWSRYMPAEWPGFESFFKTATGMGVAEYFRSFAALVSQHVDIRPGRLTANARSAGLFDPGVWTAADAVDAPFRLLLEKLSVPVRRLVQLATGDDREGFSRAVRDHPVLRADGDKHIVLDPVHLAEQAVVGPLFMLTEAMGADRGRVNECFTHFGNAFEHYVAELLATRYPTSPVLAPRVHQRVELRRGKQALGEIDAVIETGPNECCVMEVKAVFIRTNTGGNVATYQAAVREKYSAGTGRPKGVSQLGRTVRLLAEGQIEGLPVALRDAKVILPVLLVLDHNLDAPGHGAFLKGEFAEALAPDEDLGGGSYLKGELRALAPIVISIDDFEWIESSLMNFSLGEFLKDYSAADPDRTGEVRSFALRSDYRSKMRDPDAAYAAAMSVLDDLGVSAFGATWLEKNPR